jgi:hypothetical protein
MERRLETEFYEEPQDLDVRALKALLAQREQATSEFRRLKSTLLTYGSMGPNPPPDYHA